MNPQPTLRIFASMCVTILLGGCAGFNFYSDPSLTTKTGIPIYAPKPYLLVARTGAKDKPVEVSIVYLSDPQRVMYADPRSGFGSSNLSLSLVNGQLTAFGQQTDPKIPELLNSIGALITARAGADKVSAEAGVIRSKTSMFQISSKSIDDLKAEVKAIADDMQTRLKERKLRWATDREIKVVQSVVTALSTAASAPTAKAADDASHLNSLMNLVASSELLEIINKQSRALAEIPVPIGSTDRDQELELIAAWRDELRKLYLKAQPKEEEPPAFELYEIVQTSGVPSLRKVGSQPSVHMK